MNDLFREPLSGYKNTIEEGVIQPLGRNYITLCFSSSNAYSPFLCIAINSAICNSSENFKYEIIVLTTDLSEGNKDILTRFVENTKNFEIRFVNISNLVKNKNFYTWAHFTPFTYYRLMIPDLFCLYEKVIYLDCDIIINTDISELYELNIDGFYLAAARDTHVMGRLNQENPLCDYSYFNQELGIEDYCYFQAGVIVFNIKEFNKNYQKGDLIKKASQSHFKWLDQDFLNIECQGRVRFLDNAWNVMVVNEPKHHIDENYLPEEYYEEYLHGRKNPKIIHYIGNSIPCYRPNVDLFHYYWPYARNTPYYELLISKMINQAEARMRHQQTLKQRIKAEWVMPIVNKLLPRGSRRRRVLKHVYFKLRGWKE